MVNLESNTAETNRAVIVTNESKRFLVEMVMEAVIYRADDWDTKHQINVSNAVGLLKVVVVARPTVEEILRDAVPVTANGNQFICLISLVDIFRVKWCGIWPEVDPKR